jgi:hypothetical protein
VTSLKFRLAECKSDGSKISTLLQSDAFQDGPGNLFRAMEFVVAMDTKSSTYTDSVVPPEFCLGPFGLHGVLEVLHDLYSLVTEHQNSGLLTSALADSVLDKIGKLSWPLNRQLRHFRKVVPCSLVAPPLFRDLFEVMDDKENMEPFKVSF